MDFKYFEIPEKKEFPIYPDRNQIFLEETDAQYFKSNFIKSNIKLDTFENDEIYLEKRYLISDLKSSAGINPQLNLSLIHI